MLTKVSANREGMGISLKHTHEIMVAITNKTASKAIEYLKNVQAKKNFVPFKRYPSKGHKAGVPAGYPMKASKYVIEVLNELRFNAKAIGGDVDKVIVSGFDLGRAAYPRMRGGGTYKQGKRTNLRIFGMVEAEKPKAREEKPVKTEGEKPAEPNAEEKKTEDTKKEILTPGEEKLVEEAAVSVKN